VDWTGGERVIRQTALEVWPGRTATVLTINGMRRGPTIRLLKGQRFEAVVRNQLPVQDLVLHWHGLLAPASEDGHPNQGFAAGQSDGVSFEICHDTSLCRYHGHTHGHTVEQV
jgi:blue copper oxidase